MMSPKEYREQHPGVIPDEYVEIVNKHIVILSVLIFLSGFSFGLIF